MACMDLNKMTEKKFNQDIIDICRAPNVRIKALVVEFDGNEHTINFVGTFYRGMYNQKKQHEMHEMHESSGAIEKWKRSNAGPPTPTQQVSPQKNEQQEPVLKIEIPIVKNLENLFDILLYIPVKAREAFIIQRMKALAHVNKLRPPDSQIPEHIYRYGKTCMEYLIMLWYYFRHNSNKNLGGNPTSVIKQPQSCGRNDCLYCNCMTVSFTGKIIPIGFKSNEKYRGFYSAGYNKRYSFSFDSNGIIFRYIDNTEKNTKVRPFEDFINLMKKTGNCRLYEAEIPTSAATTTATASATN